MDIRWSHIFSAFIMFSPIGLAQPVRAQYVTDDYRAQDEQTKIIEAEHAFYRELERKTFWFQPSASMRARFYHKYKVLSDEIYLPTGKGFAPEATTSFVVETYLPSKLKSYGPPRHIYQVRIEDGTIAYMGIPLILAKELSSYRHDGVNAGVALNLSLP